jgi:DNA-binding SARP family transcriptional activator
LQYRILGTLEVLDDGRALDLGGRKQRAVLAALLLDAGRTVSTDRLTDAVWGDDLPSRAEASLQAYISNLRKLLEPGRRPREAPTVLVTDPGGYRLVLDDATLDAQDFERRLDEGQARRRTGDLDAAELALDAALACWAPLLPEFTGESFTVEAEARLESLHAMALETAFEVKLDLGGHREIVPALESAVAAYPLRERLRSQLALALYRGDRQTDALRAIADARTTLVDEVGVEPGPELRLLEAQILDQGAELDWRPPTGAVRAAGTATGRAAGTHDDDRSRAALGAFVGRQDECAVLVEATRGAIAGTGRPVVISGEPGIGKTRLVEELVTHARREGMTVAWARCPESAAQASFWACSQIGTQLLEENVVDQHLLREILPTVEPTGAVDPTADRLALDVSAAKVLASTTRPLLLVIDDLQWADSASLTTIEFVSGELRGMPVILVATVRPTTADSSADLVSCLAELARQPHALRLELDGLRRADVSDWLENRADLAVAPEVSEFVHERTAGNPFFVRELVELLTSEGRLGDPRAARGVGIPAAVQDVLRRRISRLPSDTQQLLPRAAIVGRTFDVDVLARVSDQSVTEVLDALDAVLDAGLVTDDPSLPGRFRFSHALVAETLAEEISASRRARLHAAIVDAVEALRTADLDSHLAELAHHALAGALAGTAEKAFGYSAAAADQATMRLAFEDAAEHWSRAVRALELSRPGDRWARYDTLVSLGRAHLGADRIEPAKRALLDAAAVAEGLGDAEAMARALAPLNLPTLWPAADYGMPDPSDHACLERAVEAYTDPGTVLRADLLCAFTTSCAYLGDFARTDALSAEALEVARGTGDPSAIIRAAIRRYSLIWIPQRLDEQRALADEMVAVCDAHHLPAELTFLGHFARVLHRFAVADLAPGDSEFALARNLAERSNSPAHLTQWGFFEATYLLMLGRFDEAVARGEEATELYRRTRAVSADAIGFIYPVARRLEQGRLDEALTGAAANTDGSYRELWLEVIAWALTLDNRVDEAREVLTMLRPRPDPSLDYLYLSQLMAAGTNRILLDDRDVLGSLYDGIGAFPGLMVISGSGGVPLGSTDHTLALLARALDDDDAARRHIEAGIGIHRTMGATPWLARSLAVKAELHRGVDDAAAAAAAAEARTLADEFDLVLVNRQLDAAGFLT